MATTTIFATSTGFLDWDDVIQDGSVLGTPTSTLLVIENSDGTETRFIGNSFTFDVSGNITGGTMTSLEHRSAGGGLLLAQSVGHNHSMVTGANLLAIDVDDFLSFIWNGNDTFTILESDSTSIGGEGGNDTIIGGSGNDVLAGADGDDVLDGGAGHDILYMDNPTVFGNYDVALGSTGNDTVDFGFGNGYFEVQYHHLAGPVNVNLDTGIVNKGVSGVDSLVNFANINFNGGGLGVRGTSGDDTFVSSSLSYSWQQFRGLGGNNTYTGTGGYVRIDYRSASMGVVVDMSTGITSQNGYGGMDTFSGVTEIRGTDFGDVMTGDANHNSFIGRGGDDIIDGGDGFDRVRYDRSGVAAVNVNLITGVALDGLGGTDTLTSIEWVRGSINGDDVIIGRDDTSERLDGGGGNDTLTGNGGYDRIYAGSGNDTINGGADDDTLSGDAGNDIIDGGSGFDFLDYINDAGSGGGVGVTVNLTTGVATDGFGDTDTLSNIENVRGTMSADNFTGSSADFERFQGMAGNDVIDGGAGWDEVYYDNEVSNYGGTSGITVDLAAGTAIDSFGNTDTLTNIEQIAGTSLADTITGSDKKESFLGNAGNDIIDGGKGLDTVRYDTDIFWGGAAGVNVNLLTGVAIDGFGHTDSLSNITHVRGTGQADILTGGGNQYYESFWGKAGDDIIDGGDGLDRVEYRGNTGVTVNFAIGIAIDEFGDTDTLSNIEYVIATDGDDDLTGGNVANNDREVFSGRGGNDVINGGTGFDVSIYIHDHYEGGTSGIVANLTGGGAGVVTDAYGDTDTLTGIEAIYGSVFNDTITGSSDDEAFLGAAGNDIIDGGGGYDLISYFWDEVNQSALLNDFGTSGVTVNLTTNSATDGYGDTDTLTNIEAVESTRWADNITGDGADNGFFGHAGNDSFDGAGGNDLVSYARDEKSALVGQVMAYQTPIVGGVNVNLTTGIATDSFGDTDTLTSIENVEGGSLADTIVGSAADNRLFGLDGDDTLAGGAGDDLLVGDAGNDTLRGGDNDDRLRGKTGADNMFGDAGVDDIRGGENNDTANGGDGNDFILGEQGDDLLYGGNGNDNIKGGEGVDRLRGNADNDKLYGGSGDDDLRGGDGVDIIYGDADNDYMLGEAGADFMYGGTGNDDMRGGADSDKLKGNDGADDLRGEAGDDKLFGGSGDDDLQGGDGVDLVFGDDGADTVSGGIGDDFVFGGRGNDTVYGDDGADRVRGNLNNDMLFGGDGDDILFGGGQNDTLNGGADNDALFGDNGKDILFGGAGNDTLTGGVGGGAFDGLQDTFVYVDTAGGAGGFDRVKDFENGIDLMDLTSFGFANFAAVQALSSDSGAHMRINFGGGDVLFVENFQLADFDAGDVLI